MIIGVEALKQKPKKLLIIGNGFDRYCDLESTFSSFISDKITWAQEKSFLDFRDIFRDFNFEEIGGLVNKRVGGLNSSDKYSEESPINFWIHLLLMTVHKITDLESTKWADIEQTIYDFLTNGVHIDEFEEDVSLQSFLDLNWVKNHPKLKDPGLGVHQYFKSTLILVYLLITFAPEKVDELQRDPIAYFYSELQSFEEDFKTYMVNISQGPNQKEEYLTKAHSLFRKLCGDETFNLLNFNYTSPEKDYELCFHCRHVHGDLDTHPIIGIDQSDIDKGNRLVHFTKTYRVLTNTIEYRKVTDDILGDDINELIFFGHSLSHADFSYFYSIFDHYQVYDNQVNMIFYYYVYDSKKKTELERNAVDGVIKLIDTFANLKLGGTTGGNLVHKLMLENRLHILPIEKD